MWRFIGATATLFMLGVYAGFVLPIPNTTNAIQGETANQYPYLSAVSYVQVPQASQPLTAATVVAPVDRSVDARFAGMLSHVRWLIDRGGINEDELERLDKQILSVMDDVSDDIRDIRRDIDNDGGLPSGFAIDNTGTVTAGVWQGTPILDAYLSDILTLGTGSTFANDIITPNSLQSTGQLDEYCLTYEGTGTTLEWQSCASGSVTSADFDTSAELAAILTDETGSGNAVFSASPTFTGTVNAAATLSSTLTMSGTAANIALGSNYLSGDGGDEGIFVDSTGNVGIGTTSPTTAFELASTFPTLARFNYTGAPGGGATLFAISTQAPTASAQRIGSMSFGANDTSGSIFSTAAMRALSEESWSSTVRGTALMFETTAAGGIIRSEKLRITGTGNVGIGTTTPAQKL